MVYRDRHISITILLCFSLSGFLGLIYEIVWIRRLGLIFGATVFAVTTVLAAFFGGLALGSLFLGRLASSDGDPASSARRFTKGGLLRIYAFLQGAIGLFAILFPIILHLSGWFYSLLYPYIYHSFFLLTLTSYSIPYSNLGVYYHKQGKSQVALSAYEQAVRLSPRFSEAWYGLGTVYWSLGNIDDAMEAWNHAVETKPDFASAHNNLGSAYAASGQYESAIEAYKKAVAIKPDYANAYYNLGMVYEDTRQRENAIAAYKKAIKIKPDLQAARVRLGALIYMPPP